MGKIITVNLPTLSDWSNVSVGSHTLIVKAKATGYQDSSLSTGVIFTKSAPPIPSKGDLITMNVDGTDRQFRVLNVNGNNAEVLATFHSSDSQIFASSGNIYAGSDLDTYLNSTWYNTLNATAKAAIVDKTFTQDSWYRDTTGDPDYEAKYGVGSTAYQLSFGNAAFGSSLTRHIYALSVQDIIDYLEATPSMTQANTTITMANVLTMFFNSSSPQSGNIWLRSAVASSAGNAFRVAAFSGSVGSYSTNTSGAVRAAFQIDHTKITWSKVQEGITINWSAEGINCEAGIAYKTPEMSDYIQNEMVGNFDYAEGSLFIPSTTISLYFWGKFPYRGADSASYQINNGQVIDATAYTQANPLTLTLSSGDVVTVYSTYED